jgi:hypothetical protein
MGGQPGGMRTSLRSSNDRGLSSPRRRPLSALFSHSSSDLAEHVITAKQVNAYATPVA